MPSASFHFGSSSAQHKVEVRCGYFGSEKYIVDGELVLSQWSFLPSGVRWFEAHGHKIEIRMAVNMKGARAEALVDDKLVAEDLFAEFNARVAQRRTGKPWPVKVAVWLVVAFTIFTSLKFLEQRPNPFFERTPDGAAHAER